MSHSPELKARLKSLNELMREALERPATISSILAAKGFREEDINNIRENHLEEFLDLVTYGLRCTTLRYQDGAYLSDLRELAFGIGRSPRLDQDTLMMQTGLTGRPYTKLLRRAIRPLRPRKLQDPIAEILTAAANKILSVHPECLPPAPDAERDDEDERNDEVEF